MLQKILPKHHKLLRKVFLFPKNNSVLKHNIEIIHTFTKIYRLPSIIHLLVLQYAFLVLDNKSPSMGRFGLS